MPNNTCLEYKLETTIQACKDMQWKKPLAHVTGDVSKSK